jgi:hypothetical protein
MTSNNKSRLRGKTYAVVGDALIGLSDRHCATLVCEMDAANGALPRRSRCSDR